MSIIVKQIQSQSEKEIAFEIRKKVFVEEQKVPLEEEYDEFEENADHYLAFKNGIPAGTARLRMTENGAKLERFAVLQEYRRLKIGTNLVRNLLTKCKIDGFSKVYLFAQLEAKGFYEKFNFQAKGEIFLEAGIKHIEMHYKENE